MIWFDVISTILGYLMPNPLYTYILWDNIPAVAGPLLSQLLKPAHGHPIV